MMKNNNPNGSLTPSTFGAVVLANGDFPTHPIPLAVLCEAEYLCCCDEAGMTAVEHGLMPDAIVGDGDSLPKDFQERYAAIFHKVEEQDDNDLTKATRHLCSLGKKRIVYVGATGKREDHTIGNIFLMAYYHRELGIEPVMITDHGWFVVGEGRLELDTTPGQQVSIFNISCTDMHSTGLKWPLYALQELWQGTLNEALGEKAVVNGDGVYIVFRGLK